MDDCGLGGVCGGCPWLGRPMDVQVRGWQDHLADALRGAGVPVPDALPVDVVAPMGLRDRVDVLAWREDGRTKLGLSQLDRRDPVEVTACTALSAPLHRWRFDLAADPPPLELAALRLRVAPDGARGIWIDTSNVAIRGLLDEETWIRRQLAAGVVVELGQRRKEVVDLDGALKLRERPPRPWFTTWRAPGRPTPLFGRVGGFTQPSLAANEVLVGAVVAAVGAGGRWLEAGCGTGNLTIPLAGVVDEVVAFDVDPGALEAAEVGLAAAGVRNVHLMRAGFDGADWRAACAKADGVLVDPPRSGLRGMVDVLLEPGPDRLVYVSCNAESLAGDLGRMVGWQVVSARGVAQFPQSPHCEWVVSAVRAA